VLRQHLAGERIDFHLPLARHPGSLQTEIHSANSGEQASERQRFHAASYFLESRFASTTAATIHAATHVSPITADAGSGTVCGFNGGSIGQDGTTGPRIRPIHLWASVGQLA
jgi:hypothetical protein